MRYMRTWSAGVTPWGGRWARAVPPLPWWGPSREGKRGKRRVQSEGLRRGRPPQGAAPRHLAGLGLRAGGLAAILPNEHDAGLSPLQALVGEFCAAAHVGRASGQPVAELRGSTQSWYSRCCCASAPGTAAGAPAAPAGTKCAGFVATSET